MSNQTWNNDPKPDESGDNNQEPGGYNPPGATPDQGSGYGSSAPSGASGSDAPGGYTPPGATPDQGAGYGSSAPSGASGSDYAPPAWDPNQGQGSGQGYSAPSAPDQGYGQAPSYGAPEQQPYGQPGAGQAPYGQPTDQSYGQQPYGQPGGYDPNAGGYGQPQDPYGQAAGGYGAAGQYGAPSQYSGGYQPNPYGSGPVLATWQRRAVGALVDFVAPALVIWLVFTVLLNVHWVVTALVTLGWWAYNTGYRVATTGYSFGHKIGKVRVVMEDTGQTPPMNTAITRALSHFLDQVLCLIGFLFPLWDAKKQTFADKIARTVVIDEQGQP